MVVLIRVTAPHFVAGLEYDQTRARVVRAAPILAWTLGRPASQVCKALKRLGATWDVLTGDARTKAIHKQ